MKRNNIICLEQEFNQFLTSEDENNINIISLNLEDFNNRFGTDFLLYYEPNGMCFSAPEDYENNELIIWFLEGINELLAFAYSPTTNSYDDLDNYLLNRKKELAYLFSHDLFNNYRKRYIDYAPLGFLEEENYFYIKAHLTNLILDKQNTISAN